jgi:branched-chain amino acid transport system substrate-binding protein
MRHASIFVLAAAAAFAAPACTSLNGITDFKVDPASEAQRDCTTNAECVVASGKESICRKSDGKCADLFFGKCATAYGPVEDDAAILFGVTVALNGVNASTGKSIRNAIELAVEDINDLNNGLPAPEGSPTRRRIALIECDDENKDDTALEVAKHLAETLRVPAVLGSNSSSVSNKIFTDVFLTTKTLEMSPGATATLFSTLPDEGLFWRTIPSLKLNVDGLVKAMPQLEAHVRERASLGPGAPISVGAIIKGDNFGQSSYDETINNPEFIFNGTPGASQENRPYFTFANYGNPNATTMTTDYSAALRQILDLKPHIIFMYGGNEIIEDVLPQIEAQWSTTGALHKPLYLFHANGFKVNLWNQVATLDPTGIDLRKRVLGTNAGSIGNDFNQFRLKYDAAYVDGDESSPDSLGTMNAYDAMYVLAMAAVAAGAEVTGLTLSKAMTSLVGGPNVIKVGPADASQGFNLLNDKQTIDLQGLSGPLDFDAAGDVISDIYFYCVPQKKDGTGPEKVGTYSGTKFNPTTRTLASSTGTGSYFEELKTFCGL